MNEPDPIIIESDFQLTSEPEETKPRDIQMSELTELADTLVELDSAVLEAEAALGA